MQRWAVVCVLAVLLAGCGDPKPPPALDAAGEQEYERQEKERADQERKAAKGAND